MKVTRVTAQVTGGTALQAAPILKRDRSDRSDMQIRTCARKKINFIFSKIILLREFFHMSLLSLLSHSLIYKGKIKKVVSLMVSHVCH